ncbi:hypothetical protein PFICI_12446 [Pestalotiopsis fici W106-1]|uniref:Uncharacterized protein n=1 Tax=Pestalotiopsis fici (strain W106-1 / CGMCC3.15140) TaxID=1229662 RepID=W3WQS2_PESFW|nr:uncharacterized protein PFICI_12446 [Pestalotiopsis fici W106-1]ETS75502.1 hypothetical protein PFICI_12446 [Pestalotiopsis fici W106-1]
MCKAKVAVAGTEESVQASVPVQIAPSPKPTPMLGKRNWLRRGTGASILSVSFTSLALSGDELRVSSSGGCELLCSYNWIDRPRPTIYVPGGAPTFKEVSVPMTLDKDSGIQYIDQNAARLPRYPFEVVFDALQVMNPHATFNKIDILVNRNSLRRLLEFCRGRGVDSFRLNLFVVDSTLIIERCTKSATQMIHGSQDSGYGRSFEHAVTATHADLQGSMGHHCVLNYNLGALKCAVRFEVDACVVPAGVDPETQVQGTTDSFGHDDVNSLVRDFQIVGLKNKRTSGQSTGSTQVIRRGPGTSPNHMAEIKANAKPPGQSMPQMWFGRTPHLIRGRHDKATFTEVSVDNISLDFEVWENQSRNQEALQKMVGLISRLREIVQATPERACVAVCERSLGPSALEIFHSTGRRKPLPDHLVEKFWTSEN